MVIEFRPLHSFRVNRISFYYIPEPLQQIRFFVIVVRTLTKTLIPI